MSRLQQHPIVLQERNFVVARRAHRRNISELPCTKQRSSLFVSNLQRHDGQQQHILFASDLHQQHIPLFPPISQNVAAIVFGDGPSGPRRPLYPLTKRRSEGAIPIAANYRLIDAVISNCINSNITKIYALTQFNSTSLNSHLTRAYSGVGLGKDGLVEVIAAFQSPENQRWFQGNADAVRRCLWMLEEHPVNDFLILPGHHLYKMDYQILLEAHRKANSDITIVALSSNTARMQDPGFGTLKVNPENRVLDIAYNEVMSFRKSGIAEPSAFPSTGIYMIKRNVLVKLLKECFPDENDIGKEVVQGAISLGMKVSAYFLDGYWEDMGSIGAFYRANMENTSKSNAIFDFYDRDSPVYTLPRCLPPSIVSDSIITDSLIGDGCVLNKCKVKRSVVGMRTRIEDGATVEDSVVMGSDAYEFDIKSRKSLAGSPPLGIGANTTIRKSIVDKNARIGKNVMIINKDKVQEGDHEAEGYVIRDGIIVVLRGAVIPDNSIL